MRFRWVYVCVSLYIYSIEQPGCLGDTGCAAWGLADPFPLSLFFSSSSFFLRGRGVGGEGVVYVTCMLHCYLLVFPLLLETQQLQGFRCVPRCYL